MLAEERDYHPSSKDDTALKGHVCGSLEPGYPELGSLTQSFTTTLEAIYTQLNQIDHSLLRAI